jgi:hypothetical protein
MRGLGRLHDLGSLAFVLVLPFVLVRPLGWFGLCAGSAFVPGGVKVALGIWECVSFVTVCTSVSWWRPVARVCRVKTLAGWHCKIVHVDVHAPRGPTSDLSILVVNELARFVFSECVDRPSLQASPGSQLAMGSCAQEKNGFVHQRL